MYDAGFTYHSTDGSRGAKEIAARRVLADVVVEAYLPMLRRFPDLPFFVLPDPSPDSSRARTSSSSSSDPATKRPRQAQTSVLKKSSAASLPLTRYSPDTPPRVEGVSSATVLAQIGDQTLGVANPLRGAYLYRSHDSARTAPESTSSAALLVENHLGSVHIEDKPPVSDKEVRI